MSAGLDDDLDDRGVQRVGGVDRRGAALDVVHAGTLVDDDQGPLELAHVLGVDPEVGLQRDVHVHALRHVDEAAAGPDRGVQRGELVVAHRDDRGEVLLEKVRVLLERGVGVQEDDTLVLQVLADLVVDDFAFVLRGDAGDEPLLLRLGDAEPVVGALDVRGQVVPAGGLLLGRPDEVLDVLEIDASQIRAPAGHRLAPEQLQALQPQVQHPLRLVLQRRDVPDDLLGQAPARGLARHVRVGPAELVTLQPLKLGVRDCRHAEMPPDSVVVVSAAVLIVVVRMGTSDGAVTCVVHIPSPCAIVARRCTGVPGRRPDASVSASRSCGYPVKETPAPVLKDYHKF